jgi:hypothetical protein
MTLSDTQRQILAAAARHAAGLATAPRSLPAAARNAVFRSMLKHGLLTEVPALPEYSGLGWRQDEAGAWIALRITGAGLQAIGEVAADGNVEPSTETMPALARCESPAAATSSSVEMTAANLQKPLAPPSRASTGHRPAQASAPPPRPCLPPGTRATAWH